MTLPDHKALLRRSERREHATKYFEHLELRWDNEPISFDEAIAVSQAALGKGWFFNERTHVLLASGIHFYQLSFFKPKGEGVRGSGSKTSVTESDKELSNKRAALNSNSDVLQENRGEPGLIDDEVREIIQAYETIWGRKPKRTDKLAALISRWLDKGYTAKQLKDVILQVCLDTPRGKFITLRAMLSSEAKIRTTLDLPPVRDTWLTPYWNAFEAEFPDAIFPATTAVRVFKALEKKHTPERVVSEFQCYLKNCKQSGYAMSAHVFARRFGHWQDGPRFGAPRYQQGLVTKPDADLKETLS